jgi:hypothetical protein
MIYRDEIIAEVWRNRDAYAAQHHNSLNEMVADLRERQKRPGCKIADRRGSRAVGWSEERPPTYPSDILA